MNPLFRIDFSISDSLKIVRKSVLIYETIIFPAACAAGSSIMAKRHMSGLIKNPLQVNLRRIFIKPAAWLNSYEPFVNLW